MRHIAQCILLSLPHSIKAFYPTHSIVIEQFFSLPPNLSEAAVQRTHYEHRFGSVTAFRGALFFQVLAVGP